MKDFDNQRRVKLLVKGVVQGVGFRPYLYRSAQKYLLTGFVKNTLQGVAIEVEGHRDRIGEFIDNIRKEAPPLAYIEDLKISELTPQFSTTFEIIPSENAGLSDLLVSPDIAICKNCKEELFSPQDRRYLYPFINCTDCGPRFSIIQGLPYDRPLTTMKVFDMCKSCESEYTDPYDRRYHAQPVSCYECGPSLTLSKVDGEKIANPLEVVPEKLKEGKIVAIKGLGGYHLACSSLLDDTVLRLREMKGREKKPFALMGTLEMIQQHANLSEEEIILLSSSASPIVLLRRREDSSISKHVAPDGTDIGFMLPYTPLHLLIIDQVKEPLVMTSANISDEPIIYSNESENLKDLSDYILSHNRDIQIFADDSVARVCDENVYMIRRSRGHVPLPLKLPLNSLHTILGLGGMLKTTFTFFNKEKAFMSQYIGNTDSPASIEAEKKAIKNYMNLFSFSPDIVVVDKHPGYPNREIVDEFEGAEVAEIQHHKAHVGALLAETGELNKIIGVSLDGTGYGDDGNIWGGEFFVGDYQGLTRLGHFKYLPLPSGDLSAKEPWRFTLSMLHSMFGSGPEVLNYAAPFGRRGEWLLEVINKNTPMILTSSCGRLFDAVSSILGLGDFNSYEGELPIRLQACAQLGTVSKGSYDFSLEEEKKNYILNFLPAVHDIIQDKRKLADKALLFHRTLANGIRRMTEIARETYGINKVGLTGGVFQNTLLLTLTKDLLKSSGFTVLVHSQVPANDGGISLGQVFLAAGKLIGSNKEN
jgi:hydrogenase maturation protein HypF